MASKLDTPLEELVAAGSAAKANRRGGALRSDPRSTRRQAAGQAKKKAPAAGVHKRVKKTGGAAKPAGKPKSEPATRGSKVLVDNLPKDVTPAQIKEYFTKVVGKVKAVVIDCDQDGKSRGSAKVSFPHEDTAAEAFTKLNGLLVDNVPIKIEIILSGQKAESVLPQPKSIADRVSAPKQPAKKAQPKSQPKSAAIDKKKADKNKKDVAGARGGKAGKRRGRNGRNVHKTEKELDDEMTDYFNVGTANPAPAQADNSGDAAMDEIA